MQITINVSDILPQAFLKQRIQEIERIFIKRLIFYWVSTT